MKDTLVSSSVLEGRVAELEKWVKETAPFAADGFRPAADYLLADFRAAIKRAGDAWRSTSETVRLTGWDRKTLLRHARALLSDEPLPRGWGELEVRLSGNRQYLFRVSSVPARGRKSA